MSTATQTPATPESPEPSTTPGLFSGDFVRPGEKSAYVASEIALLTDLAPVGVLEETLAEEIHRAMWRLRRCGEVEAHLVIGLDDGTGYIFDTMETTNAGAEKVQRTVDRSRSQAHRLLHKCTAELRKIQTGRQYRNEIFDAGTDLSDFGLADWQSITKSLNGRREVPATPAVPTDAPPEMPFTERTPRTASNASETAPTASNAAPAPSNVTQIARNAPCHCNSGLKYKRCCGKDAPAILQAA